MPLYLKEVDVIPEVSKFKSALSLELFGVTPILHHKKEVEVSFMNSHKKTDGVSAAGPFT